MEQVLAIFPGWFEDICDIQLFFSADLEVPVTPYTAKNLSAGPDEDNVQLFYRQALFSSGAIVQGFARIRAPPGSTVRHEGISCRLESNFLAMGDIATRELLGDNQELVPPGYVSGTVDVPFRFDCTSVAPLYEHYEGGLFSIRHAVIVTLARPWYTFAVTASAPFAVQRVHEVQRPSASARRGTEEQGGVEPSPPPPPGPPSVESQLALYGQQEFAVDLADEGSLTVIVDKGCYELTDRLSGTIEVAGATVPIVMVRFALVRVEFADGEVRDSVIYEDTLLDARRWRMRKLARLRALDSGDAAGDGGVASATASSASAADALPEPDGGGGHPALAVSAPPEVRTAAAAKSLGGEKDVGGEDDDADADAAAAAEVAAEMEAEEGAAAPAVNWWPEPGDLEGEDIDPDVPLVGDGNINIALELRMLEIGVPTVVIPLDEPAGEGAADLDHAEESVSVRYFVRLSAYKAFTTEARHWNAMEIVLFREGLHGRPVPASRLPAPLAPGSGLLAADSASAVAPTDATSSTSAGRAAPQLPTGAASPIHRSKSRGLDDAGDALDVEEGLGGMGLAAVMTRETPLQPPTVLGGDSPTRDDIVARSRIEPDVDPGALHRQ